MVGHSSRTIFVGNLPLDVRKWEIEHIFYKYGRILDIELKLPHRPPGYCFVEFKDAWAAEDAIRGCDGYNFDGYRIRVELAHGRQGRPFSFDRHAYTGGGGGRYRAHIGGGGGRYGASHRSEFRVLVQGLPPSASWQDLKDHMRNAGDVCFAEVFRDADGAVGIVDYCNYEDMKNAVKSYEGSPHGGQSRSRSRSRSRSLRRERSISLPQPISKSISASRPRPASHA